MLSSYLSSLLVSLGALLPTQTYRFLRKPWARVRLLSEEKSFKQISFSNEHSSASHLNVFPDASEVKDSLAHKNDRDVLKGKEGLTSAPLAFASLLSSPSFAVSCFSQPSRKDSPSPTSPARRRYLRQNKTPLVHWFGLLLCGVIKTRVILYLLGIPPTEGVRDELGRMSSGLGDSLFARENVNQVVRIAKRIQRASSREGT